MFNSTKGSVMIDVRTDKEWSESGIPAIGSENLVLLSWRLLPSMSLNPEFAKLFINKIDKNKKILFFLCGSGVRSLESANFAISSGYQNCYNIADGFYGWKNNNLPLQFLSTN